MRVSVIGGGTTSRANAETAEALGRELASRGHTVVCGGRGGTMEAVCRGAKAEGGRTIGILPTERTTAANEYVDVPIATGIGHARNALVALNGEGVIALPGGAGTLTEIGFALIYDRPVAGLDTHDVDGVEGFVTPGQAVDYLEANVDPSES